MIFLPLLLLVFQAFHVSSTYKYLVYNPVFGHSQCKYFATIADTLTEAGHDVTLLMPGLDRDLLDKTGIKLTKKIILVEGDQNYADFAHGFVKTMQEKLWEEEYNSFSWLEAGKGLSMLFQATCEMLISNQTLLEQLRNEKFDVGIAEPFYICGFGIFEHLGIDKVIAATSTTHYDVVSHHIGEPVTPSYVPSLAWASGVPKSMFDRALNAFDIYASMRFFSDIYEGEAVVLEKHFGDSFSGVQNVIARSSIQFTQSIPYIDFPRPKIAKTIEIGGIASKSESFDKLDKKFDKILSERPENVLLSFGTVTKSKDMPESYKKNILKTMASLPNVTFIWKYEEDTSMADHLPNVHLVKWQPQTTLLADSRLSLFITHGGLGSTLEVAYSGKPAVMIPLFADQPKNAAMLARMGNAMVVPRSHIENPENLKSAILTVLNDNTYTLAAQKMQHMLKEQPFTPKETLIRYSEFVAKFGPLNQLDPYGRQLSYVEYYLLDVIALVLAVFSLLIIATVKITRWCCTGGKKKVD